MLSLIPTPKMFSEQDGFYALPEKLKLKSDFDLPLTKGYVQLCDDANIVIKNNSSLASEAYSLCVNENGIAISASTKTGAYYALQTIRQIGKLDLGKNKIPYCQIDDEPRFAWRGIQLDESRHFFGVDEVKSLLDSMFSQKLNVFHWHLTDDQGWRIEIKKYPLLTEIGSIRKKTQIGGWWNFEYDNVEHKGFYTQQQIKEIVEYARERGIMVVPEIDFPAHCASAFAGYKHLACREIDSEVLCYFGGFLPQWKEFNWRWNRTVCCGKDSTFEFIFGVLDEVCELFDAPYLHMGGDEAPQTEWKHCDKCQSVIKQHNLKDETQLQGWFENKINQYLKQKGKKLICWNEVLKAENLDTDDKNVVIQYWTPKRDINAENYVNSGGQAILSNHQAFYFDMPYAQIPLDKTYNYKPEDFGINSQNISNVLGYEGELWSEWIADSEKLQMNTYPRMQALAEIAWSPENKIDFANFKKRLDDYKSVFEKLSINYAVDEISLQSDKKLAKKICKKFNRGNPYLEVELNKQYKTKGVR